MTIKKDRCYSVFKNILITKGHNRNLLFDFQRENIFFVPDVLVDIIEKDKIIYNNIVIEFCKSEDDIRVIDEYFSFLIENEMIFELNESLLGRFPKISEQFEEPTHISNMVIDIDSVHINLPSIFDQLKDLLCSNLEIRFYSSLKTHHFENILDKILEYEINNVFITLPYGSSFSTEYISRILKKYNFIQFLFFYSSNINSVNLNMETLTQIIHTTKKISPQLECGLVCQNLFNLSHKHYFESLNKNTCLNKKISVDSYGNIKNCPSMKESFGSIFDTTLRDVLLKSDFKKYWEIKKDDIAICKDCEFRHICTDCRAHIEYPDDIYSKPLKCGYSPYTNKWEDWSTNPLKQKAIEHYGMQDFVTKK